MNYSVLMSVYFREKPEYLETAMQSIFDQTVKTDDFVLVCDGRLNAALDAVIENIEKTHAELHVVRLDENRGLGNALNTGTGYCKNELIARMDSDDISRPDRCEKQLKVFKNDPNISICSGFVEEFAASPAVVESLRTVPEKPDEIVVFAQKRNPFNHPCVMVKKSAVEAAAVYFFFVSENDFVLNHPVLKSMRYRILNMTSEKDSLLSSGRGYSRVFEMGIHFLWGMGEGGFDRFLSLPGHEVHSTYINLLVSYGLIGFLAYVYLFLSVLVQKEATLHNLVCFSGLLLYFVTHNGIRNTLLWILLAVILLQHAKPSKALS